MSGRDKYLVVGGDSLVGGGLLTALARRNHNFSASTRRKDNLGRGRTFLDFESADPYRVAPEIAYAFVVAAATNYDRCENDPMARVINVNLIPRTVASLLEQGVFVTFISTNSVFGGERPWPKEDDLHDPQIAYAKQKSDGERAVRDFADKLDAHDRLNVVRLTKIMNAGVSPLPAWIGAWEKGQVVHPFQDLVFAPMSVRFVGEALATIGEKRVAGNLHLSGAENVDYVSFAQALARRRGFDPELIRATTAVEKSVHIAFKPKYSGLGMGRTTELTGIKPQPFDELIADLDQ